ncbi:hypothetical protein K435DRAFT_970907 [Dendrothele bispora CBS 962.96]|uniref:F-box domain-containing protein n=1 Tax=Dendrothele bispora (strain CBS 962.96) TaxID=1314807 RepID=A0A4S8L8W7_DENBC|nr:hypothetical protein K435DRAFT_970907 [Dendrothele bispora CBS 962.96]
MLQPTSFVSSMPDPFPQELVDRIIDEVRYVHRYETHRKAIWKACSSVCRSWRTRAMHHLVRSFSLNLSGTRDNITIKEIQALPRLIKFKAPPTFPASFVTRVCISCAYKFKIVQEVMCSLHLYPNLRELNLHYVPFSDFSRSKFKTLSKALDRFPPPPLHRLELHNTSFIDPEHFLSFIGMSHFSTLTVLGLFTVKYEGIFDCWLDGALIKHDPLSGEPSFASATSLSLREGCQNTGRLIMDIIRILGKSITELELEIDHVQGWDFDPNQFPSLRRLSLTFDRLSLIALNLLGRLTVLNALTHFSLRVIGSFQYFWMDKPDREKIIQGLDHALTPISRMPSIQEIVVPKLPGAFESLIESRKTGHLVEGDCG